MALVDLIKQATSETPCFSMYSLRFVAFTIVACSCIADNRKDVGVKLLVRDVPILKSRELHFLALR
jgi:hypothetical protein